MGIITTIQAHFEEHKLNANGQPRVAAYRAGPVADRQVSELIGLIRMALADGELEHHEVAFLLQWMESNSECIDTWPASAIYPRLAAALNDGVIDADEELELLQLLKKSVGQPKAPIGPSSSYATRLPLTEPAPAIHFPEHSFCFTGKLMSGSRVWALSQVKMRGGFPANSVSKQLNYIVIGELGSRDWVQSTHGRKIEKAVAYTQEGTGLVIVSEEHWFNSL